MRDKYIPKFSGLALHLSGILADTKGNNMSDAAIIGSKTLVRIMHAVHAVKGGDYTPDLWSDLAKETGEIGQLARMLDDMARGVSFRDKQLRLLRKVIPIGGALSAEKDFNRFLATLVVEAQSLHNAKLGFFSLL